MELPELPTECPECGDAENLISLWMLTIEGVGKQPEWWCWECAIEMEARIRGPRGAAAPSPIRGYENIKRQNMKRIPPEAARNMRQGRPQ